MRLYYDDAYTLQFSARVTERLTVDGHPALILDQTYFYPTSGGQPNDLGTIDGVPVIDVIARQEDGEVVHVLERDVPAETVAGVIDRARRIEHMQHHTGQHILSQAFVQIAGASTVGFHLSTESITIDLDRVNLSDEVVAAVEDLANEVVLADRPVTARIIQPDDAEGVRIRKMPEHLLTGGLRIIDIDGFDVTACGGTHVARTGEIGLIKVLRLEKRGDKTRVEFRCGGRALRDYREKNAIVNQLMADFTCAMSEVTEAATRLQEEVKSAQRALKSTTGTLLDYEAAQLSAETLEQNGMRIVKLNFADRDFGDVRGLASRITQEPGRVALLAVSGAKAQIVFARSADLSADMNALLKRVLPLLNGGRGGGQPQMAQGGGSGDAVQVTLALDEAERALLE